MAPDDQLEMIREHVARRDRVVAAYLFGSTARGAADPGDVDIAVMFTAGADGFAEAQALHVELETLLDAPVDVHDFDTLPVDVQFRVLDEGIVIADRDRPARIEREIAAAFAYYDFRPYLDRIRAGSLRRMTARAH